MFRKLLINRISLNECEPALPPDHEPAGGAGPAPPPLSPLPRESGEASPGQDAGESGQASPGQDAGDAAVSERQPGPAQAL